jgi:hypothetical protein
MSKPNLSFRPKPELADAIKAAAAEERRPTGQFIAIAMEDWLAQRHAAKQQAARQRSAA